jgi:hypothetical protein
MSSDTVDASESAGFLSNGGRVDCAFLSWSLSVSASELAAAAAAEADAEAVFLFPRFLRDFWF